MPLLIEYKIISRKKIANQAKMNQCQHYAKSIKKKSQLIRLTNLELKSDFGQTC